MRRVPTIALFAVCAWLLACEPLAGDAGTDAAAPASAPTTPAIADTTRAAPRGPALTFPKAAPRGGDVAVEAFYPRPMVVHRCLALAVSGSDQTKDACERALRLEPGNEQLQAALAKP